MNAKKKREKRIYKQGLMNGEERTAFGKERAEEIFVRKQKGNKKLKRDINNNPIW